jgi:hypothetical protein
MAVCGGTRYRDSGHPELVVERPYCVWILRRYALLGASPCATDATKRAG